MSTSVGSSSRSVIAVAGRAQVAVDRVEEPERGVGRVVEALVLAFREHVRDQAVAHVMGERAQDVAAPRRGGRSERQPSRLIIVSRPQSVNQ